MSKTSQASGVWKFRRYTSEAQVVVEVSVAYVRRYSYSRRYIFIMFQEAILSVFFPLLFPSSKVASSVNHYLRSSLPAGVAAVNDDISTSGVGGSVGNKVDVSTLELLRKTVTAQWDHAVPKLLDVLGNEVGETSVNVTGRDAVDTGKVTPLVGERAGHVDAASLGDVV